MTPNDLIATTSVLLPASAMLLAALASRYPFATATPLWRVFHGLAGLALAGAIAALALHLSATETAPRLNAADALPGLSIGLAGLWLAVLVQFLGMVIGAFSARYLQGESGQRRYVAALSSVLAAVHLLLLADHWLVLIGAWAGVGLALQHLLRFYPERPFAQLAAHKKRLADRLADALLLLAAGTAFLATGSGSIDALLAQVASQGMTPALEFATVCLVLATLLRTALLPVHGWLIQVMEAPTPVSALLHAGVVNLGGFVLIRFAPLLDASSAGRWLLVAVGLATAVLAGFVMLTRISIKVRLAWSTVAQMGFLVLECGLGLYPLALLHLIGHSLYKAHAFLSAASAVRETRLAAMCGAPATRPVSLYGAPLLSLAAVAAVLALSPQVPWPWWWSGLLALAWAPGLWVPQSAGGPDVPLAHLAAGMAMAALLTAAAVLGHLLPTGVASAPNDPAGIVAVLIMALAYAALVVVRSRPGLLEPWRRWSYAGFYVDEYYTRFALTCWPAPWARASSAPARRASARLASAVLQR